MAKKNLLLEDFIKFVPEFMLDQACESCAKRWELKQQRYKVVKNSEDLAEDLRQLFVKFLYSDPMFTDSKKKAQAISYANKILNLIKDDVMNVLFQVGKERHEILGDLKAVVRIRVSEYMRLV